MRIFQPMMFVGLGGTGCKVGAELEKRLREELCGPDGTDLINKVDNDTKLLPYQLPSCLQFVYADLSSVELQRVRREVVPGREHDQAAQKTMRLITDLVPAGLNNSADVAESLRIHLDDQMVDWLPPKDTDPRIGPLVRGAGQLPTVGRAVLFETIRRNADTALSGVKGALKDINESAGDLKMVSGSQNSRVDPVIIFVVFSVAGGTGSGIFYDYLHLIGDVMQRGNKQAEIYPLVLMPSAFDEAQGGGRAAELNAGSALIELFRLIDDQNAQGSPDELDAAGTRNAVSVNYPRLETVQLPANLIQTAFLFGRPVGGVRRDDLHRSMVSLMVSLVSAGASGPDDDDENGRPDRYQSFADGFINSAVERYSQAETGVGRRGVTTSTVAALTTPLLEITDIVSNHLLARATSELRRVPGATETNKALLRNFVAGSRLDRVLEAQPMRIPPHENPVGYNAVVKALTDRANAMGANVARGQEVLAAPIAKVAQEFDPVTATGDMLHSVDLFRARRIVYGHPDLREPLDKGGFNGLLLSWQQPPQPPPGLNSAAPPMPDNLPRKVMQRMRMIDPPAQAVARKQDSWYAWQTRRLYNAAWKENEQLWKRPWNTYQEELRAIYEQFESHERNDPQQFEQRSRDLYKPRVGVAYLLPPEDHGLEGFYQTVLARLKQQHGQQLPVNAHEGHLLNVLVGGEGWQRAYDLGRKDPEAAVGHLRQLIKRAVTQLLRPGDLQGPALIPRMADLLTNAALRRDKSVTDSDLNRFKQKLAELVPGGFAPDGFGGLKALFTYPADEQDPDIERYLRREVPLPADLLGDPEFRAVQGESMVVVLTRSSMGVTEVPELRGVIKQWAEAQRHPRPHDYLAWRRRLSQETGYLLMDPEDRQHILHRLLCAAWDGKIQITGDPSSPDDILVDVGGREAVAMRLKLGGLGALSSWASMLQAYEEWILTDNNPNRRSIAGRLMTHLPRNLDRSPEPPAPVFLTLVDSADQEAKKIKEAERNPVFERDPQLSVFRDFWLVTLPGALGQRLTGDHRSLSQLRELVDEAHGLGR
jgi:hypothetical protein